MKHLATMFYPHDQRIGTRAELGHGPHRRGWTKVEMCAKLSRHGMRGGWAWECTWSRRDGAEARRTNTPPTRKNP